MEGWVHDAGLVGRPVEMIYLPAMGQASYISIQTHQTGPDDNKQVCLDVTSSFGPKLHVKSEFFIQFVRTESTSVESRGLLTAPPAVGKVKFFTSAFR